MQIYSVKDVSNYIQNVLKKDPILSNIWIEGEVSNYNKNVSGHVYFRLKDDKALISCMIFKSMSLAKTIDLKDGDKVKVRASITTYPGSSTYQLLVKECQYSGVGDLYKKYLDLKSKLELEGYFSETHKKRITKYPKSVGVITSSTGAAVNDICRTIKRRYPICDIVVYHCAVQGEKSAESIIEGIQCMDNKGFDTLIVGRGGGSFEDLNSYNDENLLIAIYNAKTPIISAVGHENDFMLSDFVADLRASTPTAAAELATVDFNEIKSFLKDAYFSMNKIIDNRFFDEKEELEYYQKQLEFLGPQNLIKDHFDRIKEVKKQLYKQYNNNLKFKYDKELDIFHKLNILKPDKIIEIEMQRISDIKLEISKLFNINLKYKNLELNSYKINLEHLNPRVILEKGYAKVVKNTDVTSSVNDVDLGDDITLIMKDGKLNARISDREKFNE